jgi:hypothetical protein
VAVQSQAGQCYIWRRLESGTANSSASRALLRREVAAAAADSAAGLADVVV